MGGEGAMMAMITSLKNNSRRKNRNQFNKDKLVGYGNGEKMEFDFPEVTPEILRKIRDRLQKERRQSLLKLGVSFSIVIVVLMVILNYL